MSRGCQCQIGWEYTKNLENEIPKQKNELSEFLDVRKTPDVKMGKRPFQGVSPVGNGDFPLHHVSLLQDDLVSERNFARPPPAPVLSLELEIIQVKENDLTQISKSLRLVNSG